MGNFKCFREIEVWSFVNPSSLGRPDTPDVEPEAPIAAVGIQATPIVVQEVTIGGTVRRSRPPKPAAGIEDGATVVAAAGNWGILG